MDFLGIGVWEIILILLLALTLWSPSKILSAALTLGKFIHDLKKGTSEFVSQITGEITDRKKEDPPRKPEKD